MYYTEHRSQTAQRERAWPRQRVMGGAPGESLVPGLGGRDGELSKVLELRVSLGSGKSKSR